MQPAEERQGCARDAMQVLVILLVLAVIAFGLLVGFCGLR
jgi:hypothetical protein